MKKFFLIAALICALAAPAFADDGVTALELFTSQGCSNCPAADQLLGSIADKPEVIALSCHVTYWDRGGWKDTLDHEFCTGRQMAYAKSDGFSGKLYTPMIAVNGEKDFIGSHTEDMIEALDHRIPRIGLSMEGGLMRLELPQLAAQGAKNVELMMFTYEKFHTQKIGAGENEGAEVKYINSVSQMSDLGSWTGAGETRRADIGKTDSDHGYAVLAQDQKSGRILAAGKIEP